MNRHFFTAVLLVIATAPVFAQRRPAPPPHLSDDFYNKPYEQRNSGSYDRNTQLFSIGLGAPSYGNGYYYNGYYANDWAGPPPLYLKYEHALRPEIGLGGDLAFALSRNRYVISSHEYTDHRNTVGLSVLGFYHFNKLIPVRRLDVYAALGITFRNYYWSDDYTGRSYSEGNALPSLRVGARYYFTRRFGVFGDFGEDGISFANFGVSWRYR